MRHGKNEKEREWRPFASALSWAVTEKMLIQHLKQLEADGLVIREAKPVVPA